MLERCTNGAIFLYKKAALLFTIRNFAVADKASFARQSRFQPWKILVQEVEELY